ncbi:LOW QUALITY PROTEIN: hypothetical protein U9M48_013744, partial [Paspalum notatum var. saurae]
EVGVLFCISAQSVRRSGSGSSRGATKDGRFLKAAVTDDAKQLALDDPSVLLGTTPQGLDRSPLEMDQRLLEAAACGHAAEMKHLALHVPGILHGTTPRGNTCLHTASIHGHEAFCKDVLTLSHSLPLLSATARHRHDKRPLASGFVFAQQLSETILKQDKHRCNALHHAIRYGHRQLALELTEAETALSHAVNQYDESPMFIAVMRDYVDVFEKLLEIPGSAHGGACGYNALHAADYGDTSELAREENNDRCTPMHLAALWGKIDVLRALLEMIGLWVSTYGYSLLNFAALEGHIWREEIRLVSGIMDLDHALREDAPTAPIARADGVHWDQEAIPDSKDDVPFNAKQYLTSVEEQFKISSKAQASALIMRMYNGAGSVREHIMMMVDIAAKLKGMEMEISDGYLVHFIMTSLPSQYNAFKINYNSLKEKWTINAANYIQNGWTCLHQAVWAEHTGFVEFVLCSPQLALLVNTRDSDGDTPLHLAVEKCNPKMVAALLLQRHTDVTVLNNKANPASWRLPYDHAKTLNWVRMTAQPRSCRRNCYFESLQTTQSSRNDIKSLTQTYTGNTSLVAILISTITFAAAFILPGGYSTDTGNEGLPIMAWKFAFQAFLISDALAMCSSLAVAFICIIARWEDVEFLLYYRSFTKKLRRFAYMATTTAFATGLYIVLAPRLLLLAIMICVVTSLLPIITKLLGEWPILKLRFRLRRTFKRELLDM